MIDANAPAPLLRPGSGRWPILLSVPHAGTHYSRALIDNARHGRRSLEALEDPLVDRLIWRAAALGIGAVVATAPRALIDANRAPTEMDPVLLGLEPDHDPGPRARGGLGLVPTRTPRHGDLWRRPLGKAELARRLDQVWQPYHALVAGELAKLQRVHGDVLLLDVHSMPPRAAALPRLVIGDRHGRTAERWLGDLVRRTAEERGVSTAFNDPYAGGHVVERHGNPVAGVSALQLELDRGCYLGADCRTPGPGFDQAARLLEAIARAAGEALLDRQGLVEAAE